MDAPRAVRVAGPRIAGFWETTMLHERKIGSAKVSNIVELIGPTHDPARVFPRLTPETIARHAAVLGRDQYIPEMNRFVVGIQIWVLQVGDAIAVIDTGVGNAKKRGLPRFNMLNTLVPAWLEAAGAAPDKVTHVIMTHLHGDHVGWNTHEVGGRNVPFFRNARYLAPLDDYEATKAAFETAKGVGETEAFGDSVAPLAEAKRLGFYGDGEELLPGLYARLARGHTVGQHVLQLMSDGGVGVFAADLFHSPIQIYEPEINTAYCAEPEIAIATRKQYLAEFADSGALVMPCHFGAPHCGFVRRDGAGYRFEPEKPRGDRGVSRTPGTPA
jgi:glyoxylase-like metal-dependent hydrolase (beta-lactamase superfamily II)